MRTAAHSIGAVILAGFIAVVVWWMAAWGLDSETDRGPVESWALAVRIVSAAGTIGACVLGLRRIVGARRGEAVAVVPAIVFAACLWILWALLMVVTDPH